MKKTYMKPLMEVVKMNALDMVCLSGGKSETPPVKPGKAPGREDFEELLDGMDFSDFDF